jgi:hypothetical protein
MPVVRSSKGEIMLVIEERTERTTGSGNVGVCLCVQNNDCVIGYRSYLPRLVNAVGLRTVWILCPTFFNVQNSWPRRDIKMYCLPPVDWRAIDCASIVKIERCVRSDINDTIFSRLGAERQCSS